MWNAVSDQSLYTIYMKYKYWGWQQVKYIWTPLKLEIDLSSLGKGLFYTNVYFTQIG